MPNTQRRAGRRISRELPAESFDYIVGTAILCHDRYAENLRQIHRLLKPGGQLLFFEANYWNPQVFLKSSSRRSGGGPGMRTARSGCASSG